ncbi:MAG: hypothetical protein SOY67_00305 [Collinsella sp.]|nr:hypothetical protein [Collinsella sp.]
MLEDEIRLYAASMRSIQAPDGSKEAIVERMKREKESRTKGDSKQNVFRLLDGRRGAIVKVAAVLVGAAILAGGGLHALGRLVPSVSKPCVADSTKVSGAGSGFALKAYAAGIPQADGSVLLPAGFGSASSVSEGEDGRIRVSYSMDFSIDGAGLRSVTYEIEGGEALFDFNQSREGVENGDRLSDFEGRRSFTVDRDFLKGTYAVVTYVPGQGQSLDAAEYQAAMQISESVFIVKVTYQDGSTQTNRFRVSPIEGFEETVARNRERLSEGSSEFEPLFLMSDVEGSS